MSLVSQAEWLEQVFRTAPPIPGLDRDESQEIYRRLYLTSPEFHAAIDMVSRHLYVAPSPAAEVAAALCPTLAEGALRIAQRRQEPYADAGWPAIPVSERIPMPDRWPSHTAGRDPLPTGPHATADHRLRFEYDPDGFGWRLRNVFCPGPGLCEVPEVIEREGHEDACPALTDDEAECVCPEYVPTGRCWVAYNLDEFVAAGDGWDEVLEGTIRVEFLAEVVGPGGDGNGTIRVKVREAR